MNSLIKRADQGFSERLNAIAAKLHWNQFKFGVLLLTGNGATEKDLYDNEKVTPSFTEFLDLMGDKVTLKGFNEFNGGLDTRTDANGKFMNEGIHTNVVIR